MRKLLLVVVCTLAALAAALPAAAVPRSDLPVQAPQQSAVRAGVGSADATWHVGAGSGQYAGKDPNARGAVDGGEVDPHAHGTTQRRSYGVHSRLTYRALVVEGSNGQRIALVKSDSYLAQDMLTRRVGQILAAGDSGVTRDAIMLMASHNHSSPYYTTPAWGVWLFQDAFDLRAFEYHARQMAAAIEAAADDLRPARMGATTVEHTIYKGNIVGGALADDGSPAGYPQEHQDAGLVVIRFDDVSEPGRPKPLAAFVNHGQHPESLDAYDLITADFLAPLERYVERDLGAPLIFSQGDVGSAEGPYLREGFQRLPDGVIRAWAHVGHAQTERGARYLADSIVDAWERIGRGEAQVPFSTDFPVAADSRWIPGPVSHPYPSVSNCRSESTVEGNPGSPILGLPDCARAGSNQQAMVFDNLKEHGLPVPEHYDAPGFTAVEENARLHLQAFRLGEVLLASCACEAQMDLILNLESRIDDVEGNLELGYDWSTRCTGPAGDGTWTCPDPRNATRTLNVSDAAYQRMRAQVRNDAAGWDAPQNAVAANSEPADPEAIWGNFTHDELPAELGYALPVGVGHATDYNGYTVSYREYMNRDHYRKALTSYGAHTADYMATRLQAMAGALKGGAAYAGEPHDIALRVDEARQEAAAVALGVASAQAYDAWVQALPDDVGPVAPTAQPGPITRFEAATFSWRGGSNAVDNPTVRVERRQGQRWLPFADQSGEVQTMLRFPRGAGGMADTYGDRAEWIWTASFEAFTAFPRRLGQTAPGEYRFVVTGHARSAGETLPYELASHPFTVTPWDGVPVEDARYAGGVASIADVPVVYPRTYLSPLRFVRDDGRTDLCKTCSFRPWASTSHIAGVTFTVREPDGTTRSVPASRGDDGRWSAAVGSLAPGAVVVVAPGDVVDANGEHNGTEVTVSA